MNIFVLSWIIENCVKYHCDKHVVKQILEYTQLLCTCQHIVNPNLAEIWLKEDKIYRPTHANHPSSIWTRECRENYIWLCHLGLALCHEYAYRYDKQPSDHKCYSKLLFLIYNVPDQLPFNNGMITQIKLAMPDNYKNEDSVKSYRDYYIGEKQRMLVWRKREPPHWIPDNLRVTHYNSELNRLNKLLIKLNKKRINNNEELIIKITSDIKNIKSKL